jgi:hypothetical protein
MDPGVHVSASAALQRRKYTSSHPVLSLVHGALMHAVHAQFTHLCAGPVVARSCVGQVRYYTPHCAGLAVQPPVMYFTGPTRSSASVETPLSRAVICGLEQCLIARLCALFNMLQPPPGTVLS